MRDNKDTTKKPYETPKLIRHGNVEDITKMAKTWGIADMGGQQHFGTSPPGS